jgi:ferredoxin, 2Fe-2S
MTTVTYIAADGSKRDLTAKDGDTVMTLAVRHGVRGIEAECGGALSCATCHVYVDPADAAMLQPLSPDEDEMLIGVAAERRPESRLACQLKLAHGLEQLTITLPTRQS